MPTCSKLVSEMKQSFLKRYQPHIRKYARLFVVPNLLAELDRAVASELPSAIARHCSSDECVATLIKLGLPPVDLSALVDGRITGYLAAQKGE